MRGEIKKATRVIIVPAMLFSLGVSSPANGQDLMTMLREGPVVSVKQDADGGFDRCTAVAHSKAPASAVWRVLMDFESYKEFMPKLMEVEVKERTDTTVVVSYVLETPGRNTRYAMSYEMREADHEMDARWHSGSLEGTFGHWRLVEAAGGTLVYYTGATRNYSRILQRLEDDQQTVTTGVNVSSAIAMVRAVAERAEKLESKATD